MVAARLRLVQQLGHLAGSLNITGLVWTKSTPQACATAGTSGGLSEHYRFGLEKKLVSGLCNSWDICRALWTLQVWFGKKLASGLCNSWDIWRALSTLPVWFGKKLASGLCNSWDIWRALSTLQVWFGKKARLRLVEQLGHLSGSLNITGLVWKKSSP